MKKKNLLIVGIIMSMIITTMLTGCQGNSEKKSSSGNVIYYVDRTEMKLVTEKSNINNESVNDYIEKMLQKLSEDSKENVRAIPQKVKVKGYDFTDGIVTVDFSSDYNEMKTAREVLCRAAVVLTLTQKKEIEFVSFTVDNVPLKEENGKVLSAMKAEDFVSNLGSGNNVKAASDFTLYFANQKGSKLKEYKMNNAKYGGKSKERFIIEQLIAGPKEKGYTATLSSKVKIISIVTANNICYVDFDENFLTEQSVVNNSLVIYSIVNSLSELDEIHKVQISVNGDSMLSYHNEISISEPFVRNLDLVENNK